MFIPSLRMRYTRVFLTIQLCAYVHPESVVIVFSYYFVIMINSYLAKRTGGRIRGFIFIFKIAGFKYAFFEGLARVTTVKKKEYMRPYGVRDGRPT